ncbi:MAG: 2-C-methyl-D-erythritol 4-phosphate cytidylyltransferase [Bacteroidetes bacterium]|nr:2-C-methyl-D-erythritol 4-phosphate cytidylyltransferase [Bacteroidota bacterium]MBV6460796.1 2-C-methyl-D-erythritol 4-phosphate cytidylyltransferase [Flavobacteriales bacterium]MCL4816659.1 2-C-methyl-D-erythritol 4-phosphate cytidylyltransferase [Flavobacteriales bacterium]NOG95702.1 2-C-methyl-D-erythritol 4-phosphate cytidylyltransferase [Bacteroidota bacterium]CAG0969428.1 2-C-methyl-D-erythritol 4-phosphate cytidylyltransferase [Flavobacteriales bacterium]
MFQTKIYTILVAGGKGQRMKTEIPKQFLEIKGLPILMHTINKITAALPTTEIIIALPPDEIETWKNLCNTYQFKTPHSISEGGNERFYSVKNALRFITDYNSITGIHDGVRPLVSAEVIKNVYETAVKRGAAIPAIPLHESIRKIDGAFSYALNRNDYKIVQTPQCFKTEMLVNAYKQHFSTEFTDDASVIEKTGQKIFLVDGNSENIKITSPQDLLIAEALMQAST